MMDWTDKAETARVKARVERVAFGVDGGHAGADLERGVLAQPGLLSRCS